MLLSPLAVVGLVVSLQNGLLIKLLKGTQRNEREDKLNIKKVNKKIHNLSYLTLLLF